MKAKTFIKRIFCLYLASIFLIGGVFALSKQCSLASLSANTIDAMMPYRKTKPKEQLAMGIKARAVSLFVFPFYSAAETLYLIPLSALKYSCSKFANEEMAAKLKEEAACDFEQGKRRFIATITAPLGIISPDYISRHFVQAVRQEGMISSGGNYYSAPCCECTPYSVAEVQELVKWAKKEKRHISVVGAGMSQGKQSLPKNSCDLVINTSHLNEVVVDKESKTATVGAGATWSDLQEVSNQHGLAIQVMQASNLFTIGGSLSANCHGWDHKAGTLAETVLSVTIVNAEGELMRLEPGDPLFSLVVGGYGLAGVIVSAEISLVDNSELLDTGKVVALDKYVDYFYNQVLKDDTIELHLYRLSLDPKAPLAYGIAQNYIRRSARGSGVISELESEKEGGKRIERVGVHTARKLASFRKGYWEQEKARIVTPVATTRNEVMRAPIMAMLNASNHDQEWLQEFFLPQESVATFVNELGKLLKEYDVCLLNASLRFVKQDKHALLGYATTSDRFAVVLCFNQPLEELSIDRTREWIKRAIDLSLEMGGTYYLPYQHFASREQFLQAYPAFLHFVKAKEEIDPGELFSSQFYEQHKSWLEGGESEHANLFDSAAAFRYILSQPELKSEFRTFFRNIFLNLNEEAFIKLVENELPGKESAELYQALEKNLNKARPNRVAGFYRTVVGLKKQVEAVSCQARDLMKEEKAINGYVEIGFPGRFTSALKKRLPIQGQTFVVHDAERTSDYLQCGFPRPYDLFVPLNNYAPLTDSIDSESVDLVSLFIGLHHCPEEKLGPFVASIAKILRPGGSFLLRDHDAKSSDLIAMATLAHTSFNLGTGVPYSEGGGGLDEASEVRAFQSLKAWDALLERYGLLRDISVPPRFRKGDPTRNALVRYVKKSSEKLPASALFNKVEKRKQLQTFMTAIEWQSVAVAKDYAAFIEKTPFYMYPYFSHVSTFWKTFYHSWKEARRYHTKWEIVTSDYFLMNLFISFFHTAEFSLKGLIGAPLTLFYETETNKEPEMIELIVHDPLERLPAYKEKKVEVIAREGHEALIRIPRYRPFTALVKECIDDGMEILSIAGQKRVQLQCQTKKQAFENLAGARVIYSTELPTPTTYLNVEVKLLHLVIPELERQEASVAYIHDF